MLLLLLLLLLLLRLCLPPFNYVLGFPLFTYIITFDTLNQHRGRTKPPPPLATHPLVQHLGA
jgi:hypothetical protein